MLSTEVSRNYGGISAETLIRRGFQPREILPHNAVEPFWPASKPQAREGKLVRAKILIAAHKKRSLGREALIVGGGAGAGAAIAAVAGGGKGAGIGALSSGIAGLIYDLATRNKN